MTTTAKSPDLLAFDATVMHAFIARIFETAGWPKNDCTILSDHLITADQSGHASHGIGMTPMYVEAFEAGTVLPGNAPVTKVESGPFLTIDARLCLGQPIAFRTTERGIAIARREGVALVNLLNAFHIGRIGHYGEMVAAASLIGLFWVNVHGRPPLVAPYLGREPRFGTNPHCVAIPRPGAQPFLLDFATSEIAMGKARVAYAQGKSVRKGAVIDHRGRETDRPAVMFEDPRGALSPMGAHKGYGLSLVCELLSSVLGGASTISEDCDHGTVHNNMLMILIDPARLGNGSADFRDAVERHLEWARSCPPAEGEAEVLLPGDPEFRARQRFGGTTVIEPFTWNEICAAAKRIGVPETAIPQPK
jgi:uncharacterized oxidoreductase